MFHWKNKIASDNTIKNSLISFENDFSGLAKVIALFFPEMRHEMIMRYRAETINKIGHKAQVLIENGKIQIKPIPPKIALPLIEKMSLEHESDMHENWASLLIAAGAKPNPIHQQYADILANLNARSANFLKEIYTKQEDPDAENRFDEYVDKKRFSDSFDEVIRDAERQIRILEDTRHKSPYSSRSVHSYFSFPLVIFGTEKREEPYTEYDNNANPPKEKHSVLYFTKEDNNMLMSLERLGLIKYQYLYQDMRFDEKGEQIFVENCGVLLSQFGYSFVDCLEHPMYQGIDK